ncbi:hypothetical protein ISF_00848 [Cordyceps fumosorosea ARSEF 2679]|uniref:Uncharacterized protein n=1 Tax=Cordyceps fumosorosea (strain ARSEF 2679) TaxID=1081104 RepID=A0A168ELD8_CORFA|nr:hypothetical protein ISF_00848 [Cordyceps fumosorosea ARSEF 2679]OAA73947.1 hypothetical protein ISF_00848 [Cordyceps fumosorosea ARSEF 2679]
MCVLHLISYGCGCKVTGTCFCESALAAASHNPSYAVACVDISLPSAEIERAHACFRPQCPKKSRFEPWRCCECGGGPNEDTICKYKLAQVPDYLKKCNEFDGDGFCNHNLCMNCPRFRSFAYDGTFRNFLASQPVVNVRRSVTAVAGDNENQLAD